MRAVVFHEHGGVEKLQPAEVPTPEPGPGEVLVRVKACALNHLDLWVRQGLPNLKLPLPHVSGCDVAGVVEAAGADVKDWHKGQRVVVNPGLSCDACEDCRRGDHSLCREYKILGEHVWGGYAEFVKVPAVNLLAIPESFSFEEAAAAPLTCMTAWRMLMTRARLKMGDWVLVLGVGGGVASAAVQIAKLAGATVIATSGSNWKLSKAKELGADHLVNHAQTPFDQAVWEITNKRGVDVVVETVGQATWKQSLRSLARGGRLVTCGATSGSEAVTDVRYVYWRQIDILGSTMAGRKEFQDVMQLVWQRKLRPVVDKVFPLEQAAEAQRRLENAEQFGKIVLVP